MFGSRVRTILAIAALALLIGSSLQAAMVKEMDLAEVCENAGSIMRGTVIDITTGTVHMGGADFPTVTYTIEVTEGFKGDFITKDGKSYAQVTMLGSLKYSPDSGNIQRFSVLPDLPRLELGAEYVLMTTTPSEYGLSTTVGLGQGCYSFFTDENRNEMVQNLLGHTMSYADLAARIQGAL